MLSGKKHIFCVFFFQSHNCVTVHDVISILWFQTVFALSLCQYISSVTAYFGFFKFTYEIKVLKLGLSTHYTLEVCTLYWYFIKRSHSKGPSSNQGLKQYTQCLIYKAVSVTNILGIHNFLVPELSSSRALMGNPLAFCKVIYFILHSLYLCVLYNTYNIHTPKAIVELPY